MTSEDYDSDKLIRLRGERSLRELATELSAHLGCDINHNKIARAERGEVATYKFLCELAGFYGVPVGDFLYAVQSAA